MLNFRESSSVSGKDTPFWSVLLTDHSQDDRLASRSVAFIAKSWRSPGLRCGVNRGDTIETDGGLLAGNGGGGGGGGGGSTSTVQ